MRATWAYVLAALLLSSAMTGCQFQSGSASSDGSSDSNSTGSSSNPYWTFLDGGSVSGTSTTAAYPVFIEFNSKIYGAWHQENSSGAWRIQAAVYSDGSAGTWSSIVPSGGLTSSSNTNGATFPQFAINDGKLYLTWYETTVNGDPDEVRVAVYNGNDLSPSWSLVDANSLGLGTDQIQQHEMTPNLVSFNSKLYAIWFEGGSFYTHTNMEARVAVYNGNDSSPSWTFVDNGTINISSTAGATHGVFFVHDSKLYAAWTEGPSNNGNAGYYVRVKAYNGNDSSPSWTEVDGSIGSGLNISSSAQANAPQLIEFNSKLYCGWSEASSGSANLIHLKVYNDNDSSPSWSSVDGSSTGLNVTATSTANEVRLVVYNNTLYATWKEYLNPQPSRLAEVMPSYVKTYSGNDSAPSWSLLDGSSIPLDGSDVSATDGPFLIVHENNLFAGWSELDYTGSFNLEHIRFAEHR